MLICAYSTYSRKDCFHADVIFMLFLIASHISVNDRPVRELFSWTFFQNILRVILPVLLCLAKMKYIFNKYILSSWYAVRSLLCNFLLNTAFSSMVEGKNEEMSTSELSGGARIHYIFQSIFVKSLEVNIDILQALGDCCLYQICWMKWTCMLKISSLVR